MIAWFARNPIAANFLMAAILLFGLWSGKQRVKTEVDPPFSLDQVWVRIQVPGGTPEDIERQVLIPCEQALTGLSGVKSITSSAYPGLGRIEVAADEGTDLQQLKDEVAAKIEGVRGLPNEAERPRYDVPNTADWKEVIKIVVSGDLDPHELMNLSRQIRDDLVALPAISKVDVASPTLQEISIEVKPEKLRDFNLSLEDVSQAIQRSSLDLSAGAIRSQAGNLLLKTEGQAYNKADFEKIVIRRQNGTELLLSDIANIIDDFAGDQILVRFNQKPAFIVEILRSGDENAIDIANQAREYVATKRLPNGVQVDFWEDESVALSGRFELLYSSLWQGTLLVLITLGLFLRPAMAFWIVMGIPISFAGALIFMPFLGVTANMMSLFGFILAVGIVVDDAIVTGENIFSKFKEGLDSEDAVIIGTQEISMPVTFGMLTTVAAFVPLMFLGGFWGTYSKQIPLVVIPVLIFSLLESKLILPAHLRHLKVNRSELNVFARFQKKIANGLMWAVRRIYQPILVFCVRHRYLTLSIFAVIAILTSAYWLSGRLGMQSHPNVERYIIQASIDTESGTTIEETDRIVKRVEAALSDLREEFKDPGTGESLLGKSMTSTGGRPGSSRGMRENYGMVFVEIMEPSKRTTPGPKNSEIASRWQEKVGKLEGVTSFIIRSESSGSRFDQDTQSILIEIRGQNNEDRQAAAEELVALFKAHPAISSASSNRERPQEEFKLQMKPYGLELGLTQRDLARQVRNAFFGSEAQRVQRGIDEVKVMVRYPKETRENLHTLEDLRIALPNGQFTALSNVADIIPGFAPQGVQRIDGSRYLILTANAKPDLDTEKIASELEPQIRDIVSAHPGVSWRFTGSIMENRKTRERTIFGAIILAFTLFALLAIPFKSMIQPLIVLVAIPFGIVGALCGHVLLDVIPSMFSVVGLLALAGIAVNDAIVMVDFANQRKLAGDHAYEAIIHSGVRRFRPIFLTTITTFIGLVPLMFERAIHAQLLIPMAISLGFGIISATIITLFLIPCVYLAVDDLGRIGARIAAWYRRPFNK